MYFIINIKVKLAKVNSKTSYDNLRLLFIQEFRSMFVHISLLL